MAWVPQGCEQISGGQSRVPLSYYLMTSETAHRESRDILIHVGLHPVILNDIMRHMSVGVK